MANYSLKYCVNTGKCSKLLLHLLTQVFDLATEEFTSSMALMPLSKHSAFPTAKVLRYDNRYASFGY